MNKLGSKIIINKKIAKNRILMPPLVCFNWADENGYETVSRSTHYGERAKGGAGIIVIEATGICPEGRILDTELGLWEDGHIEQFNKMAEVCHKEQTIVLVQLVHAGAKSVGKTVYSSSETEVDGKICLGMNLEQIKQVKKDFVDASVRAHKSGLDGVEIHGAHGYLLSQFTSSVTNKRTDKYGSDLAGRLSLPKEIIQEVREATSADFIIGYRFGVNDSTFVEDIQFAKELEALGVDILNVSAGIGADDVEIPEGYNFSDITYMGTKIKEHVKIPVASVFGIREAKQAYELLDKDLTDIVAVGRGILADPQWGNKAIAGEAIDICYHCKPRCKYVVDGNLCTWRQKEIKENK